MSNTRQKGSKQRIVSPCDCQTDGITYCSLHEAAPEMLEAALDIVRDFQQFGEVLQSDENDEYGTQSSIGKLQAAIRKAEGAR